MCYGWLTGGSGSDVRTTAEKSNPSINLPSVTDFPSRPLPELDSLAESTDQAIPPELCDPRLRDLDIEQWTNVELDNDSAAGCISLYLETDHPLLGPFDPDLFVSDLVSGRSEYCSSLLVNSLLYWACVSPRSQGRPF